MFDKNSAMHRRKAEYWISKGLPEYAKGSMKKASKWQQKRREFDYCMNGSYPKTAIGAMMDEWMQERAKKVSNVMADIILGE